MTRGTSAEHAKGFTLVELMISMVVMVIAAFTVGTVIVDGQNGWLCGEKEVRRCDEKGKQ